MASKRLETEAILRERVQLAEQTAKTLLALFNCIKPEGERNPQSGSRDSFVLNIAKLNYTLSDTGLSNLLKRCLSTGRQNEPSLLA